MTKQLFLLAVLLNALQLLGQNVGINTSSPQFPLSFNSDVGDKLSLWGDGSATHYGMGIQNGLLQIFSKTEGDHIAFGYGNSYQFTERMRIRNAGAIGMELNGQMIMRNGTIPNDQNVAPGIWFNRADNSGLLGFVGTKDNQHLGFFGGPAGWGLTYDAVNSRVGIGVSNPIAPLGFAPALGKKISFYPGALGDAGIGISGNRLQIYSDNPNADIALGFDAAGVFNERFAFKPNGALAVNGNLGAPGMVLSSNGGNAATWTNVRPSFYSYKQTDYQLQLPATGNSPGEPQGWYVMGGLHNQTFVLNQVSTVKLSLKLPVNNTSNQFGLPASCALHLGLYDPSNNYIEYEISYLEPSDGVIMAGVAFNVKANLPAGTYRTHVKLMRFSGQDLFTGGYYTGYDTGTLMVEVFPQ